MKVVHIRRFEVRWGALCLLLTNGAGALAQVPAESQHGWQFSTNGRASWSSVAAFGVADGQPIESTTAPNDSRVVVDGIVRISTPGRFRFGCEVGGGVSTLLIRVPGMQPIRVRQGETEASSLGASSAWDTLLGVDPDFLGAAEASVFTPWIELPRGEVRVGVLFNRLGASAARMRTLWERSADANGIGFGPDPISSFFARVPEESRAVLEGASLAFEGRVLLQRKGCVQCHDAGPGASAVSPLEAPRLDHLGLRLNREWVERWIVDPAKVKPGTDMPSLYGLNAGDSAVIANMLCQEKPNTEDARVANEAFVLERGRKLYHTIGCVACHGAYDRPSELFGEQHADDDALMPPNNFGDLAGKWRPSALSEFLRDPLKTHPSGRMPSLKMNQDESDAIANYLLLKWGRDTHEPSPAIMGEVPTLSSCVACHAIEGVKRATMLGKPMVNLDLFKGCLDPNDKLAPRYALTAHAIEALRAGIVELAQIAPALHEPAPLDATRRQMEFLNCAACHTRDGRGGGSDGVRAYFSTLDEKADLGNEGRIPPDLTGVGFKLTTPWLKKVLAEGARARPYLATRMPVFGEKAVSGLAEGLARAEGIEPDHDAPEPVADGASVQAGRALMGKGALACATCHVFKDFGSQGTPGPRIDQFTERLRYEWWSAYMIDPSRYKPGTRMPSFESHGKSACRSILDGDLRKQIDALWSYCNLGEFMPAPEGIEHGKGLQLIVGTKPIVMRTFMESVGPRAIAVGMPSGVHFAFDAESVRLAEAWRGDFLDASSSWTGRGGENARGEGPNVWKAAAGCVLAVPKDAAPIAQWPTEVGKGAGLKFSGYSIGDDGVPTFEYRWNEFSVTEKVTTEAVPKPKILREFTLRDAPPVFVVNSGPGDNRIFVHVPADVRIFGLDQGVRRFEVRTTTPKNGCNFSLEINP